MKVNRVKHIYDLLEVLTKQFALKANQLLGNQIENIYCLVEISMPYHVAAVGCTSCSRSAMWHKHRIAKKGAEDIQVVSLDKIIARISP